MSTIDFSNQIHDRQAVRTRPSAEIVSGLIMEMFPHIRSAVDVGCGLGRWLQAFQRRGVTRVDGYDGAYIDTAKLDIPAERFHVIDFEAGWGADMPAADLAICLEVLEHVTPGAGLRALDRMCASAPLVLFSAAIPYQPGHHHINPRWPAFWRKEFAARGYSAFDVVRPVIWHQEDVSLHYRQNMMLFVADRFLEDSRCSRLDRSRRANCLTLVDEDVLEWCLPAAGRLRKLRSLVRMLIRG